MQPGGMWPSAATADNYTSITTNNMNKDFRKFYNGLPENTKHILDTLDVKSFDQLIAWGAFMGIDIEKVAKRVNDGSIDPENVDFEDFMVDEDDDVKEARKKFFEKVFAGDEDEDETDDDVEDDPMTLPENCFIGKECQELHLRIKLLNAPVPIWREIKVPSNISLALFAWVINDVMGWCGAHLHAFEIGGAVFKNTAQIKMDSDMGFYGNSIVLDTKDFPISKFFKEKKDEMLYEYDFGDGWRHKIWLKGIRDYTPDEEPGFVVHKGTGACPPEDCGGVWGYKELLEINAKKRKTAEEKEHLAWHALDRHFDPDYFNVECAQEMVDLLWGMACE